MKRARGIELEGEAENGARTGNIKIVYDVTNKLWKDKPMNPSVVFFVCIFTTRQDFFSLLLRRH